MLLESSKEIVEKIFEFDVFKNMNVDSILKKYDRSSGIYAINSAINSTVEQKIQDTELIGDIPPEGIVINNPGTYTLAGDITWNAANKGCSAITITSGNVVLDMNNHTLTAVVQDSSQLIVGIAAVNAQNITIQNGKLKDMCFYGIYADSVVDLNIKNIAVDGLRFANVETPYITPAGIHIEKSQRIGITGCSVSNLDVTASASAGIQILETINGTVSGCSLNNLVNRDGSVQGFCCILCGEITTTNCTSTDFQSFYLGKTTTFGHTVLGFMPMLCMGLTYDHCTAKNMTGCCDDCHGMSVFIDAYVSVTNFTASYVMDGVADTNTGAKATGLEVFGAKVTVKDSWVENIIAIRPQDKQSTGFSAWGMLVQFYDCMAKTVLVVDEKRIPNTEYGYGTGFGWAPDPREQFCHIAANDTLYNGCTANGCQVGFDTWYHVDSVWENITAMECEIPILVQPDGKRILSCNKCSECDPPMSVTLTNIAKGNVYPH